MTMPRYSKSCAAGSQEHGVASPDASDPDYAWIVNFNNGNVNLNHRNNNAWVRAVRASRASECQGDVQLQDLYRAWQRARKRKVQSHDQLRFETRLIDNLLHLQEQLQAQKWSPRPSTCFVAKRPKAREIHAPAFADRVVHHWLVPQLEQAFENGFIHDSFGNRRDKGTLAAVHRLHDFTRQVASGQGGGWYLQLDIANYFNSIDRGTLWFLLKRKLQRSETISSAALSATHALLKRSINATGVRHRSTANERSLVPAHKRLECAPPGRGIPIGNLSSQFFANVYLDQLDQFVKHTLRAKRYVRYVDDFVLVHHDKSQLKVWRDQIEAFLRDTLKLVLKTEQRLNPLGDGIDFLGYVIRPSHLTVRRRVVSHARQALANWERAHVHGHSIRANAEQLQQLSEQWQSYRGHFQHASTQRLQRSIRRRYPWLRAAADVRRKFPAGSETKVRNFRFGRAP